MRILNLHKYFKILNHFGFFAFFYTLLSRFRIKYHIKINEKKKFYKLLNLLKIYKTNFKLIKIGDNSDGTYILQNILKKINFCFSIGVGNIIKFEKYLFKNIKKFDQIILDDFHFSKKN